MSENENESKRENEEKTYFGGKTKSKLFVARACTVLANATEIENCVGINNSLYFYNLNNFVQTNGQSKTKTKTKKTKKQKKKNNKK
jgi:hypothetical protein